ncbi:cytochrome c [soil metagenome]
MRETQFFADGTSARPLVAGTIARDQLPIHHARAAATQPEARDFPSPLAYEDLQRGRERYDIYCAVCHGRTGDGNGMIVQRGFVRPPAFYPIAEHETSMPLLFAREQALLRAPPGHVVNVIVSGYGAMYSYADRVSVDDRWKIAGYIRALQLSRSASLEQLPEVDRKQIELQASAATQPAASTQPSAGGAPE